MKILREISVYTNGDPDKLSTFSNVPFFFIKTMKEKGIKVNTINIEPVARMGKIWNRYLLRLWQLFNPNTTYAYDRTWINELTTYWKVKNGVKKFPNSEIHFFLTFISSAKKFTNKPTVLISDWTYEYVILNFWQIKPDFFQLRAIKRQDLIMESADQIFFLFPGIARLMKEKYQSPQIHFLGNFLNCLEPPPGQDVIARKRENFKLLFIGKNHYKKGAVDLIEAFEILRKEFPKLSLDIIGMNSMDFDYLPEGIICYGYLDKEKEKDRKCFYELLREATLFINTTPKWGAYSSTLEALNFYTPIIINWYDEFEENFGSKLAFGSYSKSRNAITLSQEISQILNNPNYAKLCLNAHEAVKDFTWESLIDNMLSEMRWGSPKKTDLNLNS